MDNSSVNCFIMNMDLHKELKIHFGFDSFRKGQQEVISRVLHDTSAGAIFPTGAGKSLCYQLPAVLLPHLTLVVSPLLSLMKDQMDFLHGHNIAAARLDSTLGRDEYNSIISRAQSGVLKVLMISVERFKNERFRRQLQKMNVSLLVIDEAHCISEWGHNFRPEYLRLPDYQREFKIKNTLLLTATATKEVAADMKKKFNIADENLITTGFYRKNLFLKIKPVNTSDKKQTLLMDLQDSANRPTIIYVTLQKTAEHIAEFLNRNGIDACAYHGGMKSEDRISIQNKFMAGSLNCVVATIAFGMGIDKKDIRKVIHFDLPKSIENYSQEIGRSGRDGKESHCIVYGDKSNLPVLENFVYGDTPELSGIYHVLQDIQNSEVNWEVKSTGLSRESNIKQLPLKTLLVYLSVKKIIKPLYSYFEEYTFKYLTESQNIINHFQGERKEFVQAILKNCHSKKVWTSIDIDSICSYYKTDRTRILTALDYFEEKNWIDLTAKQAVEVYEVIQKDFDINALSEELYRLFAEKEKTEINRIHKMIGFFEKDQCLSKELAGYFGENLTTEKCGHCSYCETGSVKLLDSNQNQDPDYSTQTSNLAEVKRLLQPHDSIENLTRYFCGIGTPLFNRLRIKKTYGFSSLEKYSYHNVKKWVSDFCKS